MRLIPLNMFKPNSIFYCQFQGSASFVDPVFFVLFFVINVLCLSLLSCLQPCDDLLRTGLSLDSLVLCFLLFLSLSL